MLISQNLLYNAFYSCLDGIVFTNSTKFIIIPTVPVGETELLRLSKFINAFKRLNNVVIFEQKFENILTTHMVSFNYLSKKSKVLTPTCNVDEVFSDKLVNLHQYKYKVSATVQKSRLNLMNGKLYGNDLLFLDILMRKQNATKQMMVIGWKDIKKWKIFLAKVLNGDIDIVLNTMMSSDFFPNIRIFFKTFNTYDVAGYCALIPIPQRSPSQRLFFIFYSFDGIFWILMLISLAGLAIIWKIFKFQSKNLNSVSDILFGVISGCFSQSFSFRHTRWFHLMMIQTFIWFMAIVGNFYQSELISQLTVEQNASRIMTVDSMLAGNYNYISDRYFINMISYYEDQSSFVSQIVDQSSIYSDDTYDYKSSAANNSVLIIRCDVAFDILYSNHYDKDDPSDFYYLLPEKFLTSYETLVTTRYSPFTEELDKLSLRIFESGIKQHWKTLIHKFTGISTHSHDAVARDNMLRLNDFVPVFSVWAIGLCAALFVLLIELLWFYYRARIKHSWLGRKVHKIVQKISPKAKRERIVVRRIQKQRLKAIIEMDTLESIKCDD